MLIARVGPGGPVNGPVRASLCAALLAGVGCAAPFRAGAPIDIERHWYGDVYRQGGKRVDVLSIASGLEHVEGARQDARNARSYLTGSVVLGITGGVAIGLALGAALNADASRADGALLAAGVCAGGVSAALDRAGVKPGNLAMVILTHGDFDHAGNAAFLREKYGARVAMHAEDAEMVRRGDQGWNRKAKPDRVTFFGRMIMFVSTHLIKPAPFQVFAPDLFVEEGTALMEDGFDAKILHLPGHSRGSIGVFTAAAHKGRKIPLLTTVNGEE